MAVHDWTRVEAGIFHAFHNTWVGLLQTTLNEGLLPEGFYALSEQHAGRVIADLLTLHAGSPTSGRPHFTPDSGGTAVAEAPPQVSVRRTLEGQIAARRRTLAIRHVSGHQLIALLEIASPANKDRARSVEEFAGKALAALEAGIHLLIVDLFPPGVHDPDGMNGVIQEALDALGRRYELPAEAPLTIASYAAGPNVEVYLEHLGIGAALPEMPLFLSRDRYIGAPLEATYLAAYRGMPGFWRNVLEGREQAPHT